MKKHLLNTLLVATGLTATTAFSPVTAYGQTKKVLNAENYEKIDAPDWTSPNGSVTLVKGDATYGTYISLKPVGSGDRSGYKSVEFSSTPSGFTTSDLTEKGYTIEFDACLQSGNTKDRSNSQFIVTTAKNPNLATNNVYSGTDYIFSLSQPKRNKASVSETWYINDLNNSEGKTITLTRSKWYHFTLKVTTTGTTYSIKQGSNSIAEGSLNASYNEIPQISGFFTLLGRGSGYTYFDNLDVYEYVQGEVAQVPTISLEKINGKQRTYSISFTEGETLHYQLPGETQYKEISSGTSVEISTSTSGTLSAYTTRGTATSATATTEVSATEIKLNEPTYSISGIGEGYNKTYTIAIDNDNVQLKPTATLKYVFTPANGGATISGIINNGGEINSTEAGTYEITASAEGYTDNVLTITNNVAYVVSKAYEFSSMTKDDFADATLWKEGTDTEARWGWSDSKPATKFELQEVETNASTAIDGIELFTNKVPTIYIGYGLMAPGTESIYGVIKLKDTNSQQFAVFTYLNNYGKNTLTTVQAANKDYSLFRFSDILKEIKIYSPTEVANVTAAKYATYVTSGAVKVPANAKVMTAKVKSNKLVTTTLSAGTVIPANTAIIVNAEEAGDVSFEMASESESIKDLANDLHASTGVTADGTQYCLTEQDGKVGFGKVKAGVVIPAGKAYLVVNEQAAANFFAFDGTVTAIKNVETSATADGAYYTLQGVKVEKPTKGIYVHNGKKVVIK